MDILLNHLNWKSRPHSVRNVQTAQPREEIKTTRCIFNMFIVNDGKSLSERLKAHGQFKREERYVFLTSNKADILQGTCVKLGLFQNYSSNICFNGTHVIIT